MARKTKKELQEDERREKASKARKDRRDKKVCFKFSPPSSPHNITHITYSTI
jgi:hypothetical protein